MKKFTLLFISLFISVASFAQEAAALYQTVVFDFVYNGWGIPDYSPSFSSVRNATEYTYDGWTITIDPTAKGGNFYYDNRDNINQKGLNCLRLANQGSKIVLPEFNFPVEKIVLVGHPEATSYPNVEMGVFVSGNEASNTSKGTTETYTYEIASDYQSAGNIYEMVIKSDGSSSIMFITAIKVYPATNKLEAPVFDIPSGVYTEVVNVTLTSPTTEIEGVENVIYYYTTDGTEPDEESDETVDGKVTISESCTLKAVVSLDYNGKNYISESTSVEYIISSSVTATVATEIAPGRYFISADGRTATLYEDGVIATKAAAAIGEGEITDAEYYTFSLEPTNDNYFIKDGSGNYISAGINGNLVASAYSSSAWNVYIENGVTIITSNEFFLTYDAANSSFTITRSEYINDQTIFPVLYLYTEPVQDEENEGDTDEGEENEGGNGNEGENGEGENGEGEENEGGNGNEGENGEGEENEGGNGNEGENGIEEVCDTDKAIIYDITGRRISEITKPGIYIINGKKVIR